MNAERLLAHYERIAEAPDAIARLRRFVLELATRGKLTSFDHAAKDVRPLGELAEFIMGQAPPGNTCNDKGVGTLFVKVGEFGERRPRQAAWTTSPSKFAKEGDVLICVVGATIGKLNLAVDCAIGRSVAAIRPTKVLDPSFLYYSLMPFTLRLREDARGTAQGVITRADLHSISIWLPPLAEQRRIVAKVDELMALCDRLEAARSAREAARDRLTAASFARLGAPDPETFQADARFALDALPALTARRDQIKQLRQTILNLAVRGKLVPQDPNDEPASELLSQIRAKKADVKLARQGRSEGRPRDDDFEFSKPPGWVVTTLGEVALKITDGTHKTPRYVPSGVPFVSVKDFSGGKLDLSNTRFISEEEHKVLYRRCDPRRGDMLIGRIGTIGRAVLVDTDVEFSLFVSVGLIRFSASEIVPEFFRLLLNSPLTEREFDRIKIGGGTHTNKLNLGDLRTVALPLPPVAEQHRIVAKVDELMALCDRLEASLAAADGTRARLLDALLHEALSAETADDLEEVLDAHSPQDLDRRISAH